MQTKELHKATSRELKNILIMLAEENWIMDVIQTSKYEYSHAESMDAANWLILYSSKIKLNDEVKMDDGTSAHTCPVCGGNGLVAEGFYRQTGGTWISGNASATEKCRSCNGTGVVWKDEILPVQEGQ